MIYNAEQKSVMRAGDRVYTGSRVAEGLFLAEIDGSVVSLVTDAEALINNEGAGHDNVPSGWRTPTTCRRATRLLLSASSDLRKGK